MPLGFSTLGVVQIGDFVHGHLLCFQDDPSFSRSTLNRSHISFVPALWYRAQTSPRDYRVSPCPSFQKMHVASILVICRLVCQHRVIEKSPHLCMNCADQHTLADCSSWHLIHSTSYWVSEGLWLDNSKHKWPSTTQCFFAASKTPLWKR